MQSGQTKRIVSVSNELCDVGLQALQVMLHDFGGGDRHRQVEKDLRRFRQPITLDPLADEKNQLLRPLQGKGGVDDVSTAPEGVRHRVVEFLDRRFQRLVQTVTIGGFHHHVIRLRRLRGAAQQWIDGLAEIAREQHAGLPRVFAELQKDAGGTEDMTGVDEGGAHAGREIERRVVIGRPPETVE